MRGTDRQQEAIFSHGTSLVVSAGAGTGKTYVLVNKYMNLLETFGEGEPRIKDRLSVLNILALTFTEKAATEMKERIRTELEKKEGEFWEKSRLQFLIAPVQTFHSFCASVLREFAFEAGLEPSYSVLDEQEFSRILALSFQELIHARAEGEEGNALVSTLSLTGVSSLEKMIRYLYTRREDAELLFARLKHDPDSLISHWQEEIRSFREYEVNRIRNDPKFLNMVHSLLDFSSMDVPADDKAMMYLRKVRPFLEILHDPETIDEFLHASVLFIKESLRGGIIRNWSEDILTTLRDTNKPLNNRLKRDILPLITMEFIPGDPFSDQTIRFLQALGGTFGKFCTIVDREKSYFGGMDFTDLIRYTKYLFRTRHDLVVPYYADRYRYILIDEFQDTDPAQFEIVTTIIGEASPQVQGLFIVGDPKQSIYLFRDADVTRFKDAQELITGACAGRSIPLDVCFRSSPAVVTFVNFLFSNLFHTAEKPWEFTYNAIKISKERENHDGSVTLMLVRKETGGTEYEAVAGKIEEIINSGTGVYIEGPRDDGGKRTFSIRSAVYGDIAILLERRTHLGLFIHSLATRNIPYYVHKGTGFYKRQEILDMVSLLGVLLRPYDDVHLVGLLRSPYFGLSDLEIFRISRQPGSSFFEKLSNSGSFFPEYERIYYLLSGWQKMAGRLRLCPLIRSVLDESGILAVYGGLIEGDQILSNIEKLLNIIRTREEGGRYRLPDLVADLLDALDREEREGEAMIDDPDMNAVTVMTIHAAKGLEFPIVFVPEMAAKPNLSQGPLLMDGQRDLMGVIIPDPAQDFKQEKTPIYRLLKKELDEKLLAEKRRLLYVALTRSADHLIMSGEIGDVLPDGSNSTRLDWIIQAAGITGDIVEEGRMVLRTEDGGEVQLHITIPTPGDREHESVQPPFTFPPEFMEYKGRFERKRLCSSKPGGETLVVTEVAGYLNLPEIRSERGEEGRGAIFGSAVHEILRGRDPDLIIKEFEIEDENQITLLNSVSNDFWSLSLLSGSTEIQRERAFTVMIDDIPLSGRIDLLLRLADGTWMVIDYKSENIPADELAVWKPYRFQVEIYRRAAEILGMIPARSALYSVYEKKLVELDPLSDEEFSGMMQLGAGIICN
jgi:ATP-dependent helicase/nuclease subunit A